MARRRPPAEDETTRRIRALEEQLAWTLRARRRHAGMADAVLDRKAAWLADQLDQERADGA